MEGITTVADRARGYGLETVHVSGREDARGLWLEVSAPDRPGSKSASITRASVSRINGTSAAVGFPAVGAHDSLTARRRAAVYRLAAEIAEEIDRGASFGDLARLAGTRVVDQGALRVFA